MTKPVFTFAKAQVSAFSGGLLDYAAMIGCTEFLHIHYTISIIISGIIGAVLNFLLNRYWSFRANRSDKSPIGSQLVKFVMMVAGSVLLKAFGTYLLTNWLRLDYRLSRIVVDIIVSLGFNFVLQNFWVFNRKAI